MTRAAIIAGLLLYALPAIAQDSPPAKIPAATLGAPRAYLGTPRPATATESGAVVRAQAEGYAPYYLADADVSPLLKSPDDNSNPGPARNGPKSIPGPVPEYNSRLPRTLPIAPTGPSPVGTQSPTAVTQRPAAVTQSPAVVPQNPAAIPQTSASAPQKPAASLISPVPAPKPPAGLPVCDDPTSPLFGQRIAIPGDPGDALPRWQISTEYLAWWVRGMNLPPLVTTSPLTPDPVTGLLSSGILGQPYTQTLLGGGNYGSNERNGFRINSTWWFAPNWGLDGSFFLLGTAGTTTTFATPPGDLIARPFYDVNDHMQSAEIATQRGELNGGLAVGTQSLFWGADLNIRHPLWEIDGINLRVDGILGYRFLDLTESLDIAERTIGVSTAPVVAARSVNAALLDSFRTKNQFDGAQMGFIFENDTGPWNFQLKTKLSLGASNQNVSIQGSQTQYTSTGQISSVGGLYALNSNSGNYSQTKFAYAPEVGFNIGYTFNEHWRIFAGYNMIYWSSVMRPGDQIDQRLDVNRIPGFSSPNSAGGVYPVVPFRDTSFWAQGVSFGIQFSW